MEGADIYHNREELPHQRRDDREVPRVTHQNFARLRSNQRHATEQEKIRRSQLNGRCVNAFHPSRFGSLSARVETSPVGALAFTPAYNPNDG
jgi:hypothetical protein